tara:strand:- start:271 stop:774 length:504 start_codon:yes stop_codon:yes gene_type:complete
MKNKNIIILLLFLGVIYILQQNLTTNKIIIYSSSSDEEDYDEDIPNEPRRFYDSKYISRKKMAINVPTRGEPPQYQQVGILTGEGDENIKPLYGRQTYRGSNQWNYFTSLDSHLATKIPVYINGKDCTDEQGCKELYKDDNVNMGEGGNTYNASIYRTIAPRYIPYN